MRQIDSTAGCLAWIYVAVEDAGYAHAILQPPPALLPLAPELRHVDADFWPLDPTDDMLTPGPWDESGTFDLDTW